MPASAATPPATSPLPTRSSRASDLCWRFWPPVVVHQGHFENPPHTRFLDSRYHWLWNRMQLLALLKGIGQGYIATAPAMLVMTPGGQGGVARHAPFGLRGTIGDLLYILGRTTKPQHRIYLFAAGWTLFALGTLANAAPVRRPGRAAVHAVVGPGRPLADIAYFTIQMLVIDTVSAIEHRNKYADIFSQEFGFYIGRFAGCGLFILLAATLGNDLRTALRPFGDRPAATALRAGGPNDPQGVCRSTVPRFPTRHSRPRAFLSRRLTESGNDRQHTEL